MRDLPVPTNGWNNGGWNKKSTQFYLLAEMLGLKKPSISPDDLQELFRKVSSAKVFADNIQPFLDASGRPMDAVYTSLEEIEAKLGLLQPLPFMSLRGMSNPAEFEGVAIWPAGITNWSVLRHEEIVKAHKAGARFERVVVMWSSRKCNAPADLRHPYIRDYYGFEEGDEPTERQLMQDIINRDAATNLKYEFVHLPKAQADGRPLSLQQQLEHYKASGQFEHHFAHGYDMAMARRLYVPSTPNSLYVPLHVKRVLGLEDVWLSQAGARAVREMPGYFWPSLQEILT
ncbi:MAG: hypothetical protein ACREP9_17585, partial [Candidatus Dormibacteraceae bacterium]